MDSGLSDNRWQQDAGLTPAIVEARIDQAGRAKVFERARANGWTSYDTPPLWLWNQIALQILSEQMSKPTGYSPTGFVL